MSFADRIAEAGDEHFLPDGFLGTKAQWCLPMGVTQAIPLRWVARALLALSVALFLAWAGALVVQASSHQGPPPWFGLAVAGVVGVPWLAMAFRLWQSLGQSMMLPLRWGGLPACRPTDRSTDVPPGWSVPGWPHAISVRVVFDLGPWALVTIEPMGQVAHPRVWFWVDARVSFQGLAGHHLRALLFSTRANEVGDDQARPAGEHMVMASSRHLQRQWSNLLSSFKTIGQDVAHGASRREADAQGMAMADSDFAPTVILESIDLSSRSRAYARVAKTRGRS